MTRILVTNDDGIFSEGLKMLAAALGAVGEVTVVAPASEQSASSHSLTLSRPLRIRRAGERRYSVDGTPTDCVLLGLMQIMKENPPDIVVSGINYGANLGDDVIYSGTVAGAIEACILKVPGIAFSLTAARDFDFTHAAKFAAELTQQIVQDKLPEGTILNVNIPPGEIRGSRLTHQGSKIAQSIIDERLDLRGRNYYWIGGQEVDWDRADQHSDFVAIEEGLVSITPLRTDMTNYRLLEKMRSRLEGK
jgi:5'-nucleotidase